MRKRRVVCLVIVALLVLAVGAIALWLAAPDDPVTDANHARIQPGMTQAEVEAILGPPRMPSDERFLLEVSADIELMRITSGDRSTRGGLGMWAGRAGVLVVVFGEDDKVARTTLYRGQGDETWWDKLSRLIRSLPLP